VIIDYSSFKIFSTMSSTQLHNRYIVVLVIVTAGLLHNGVIQTLWSLNLLIRQKQVLQCILVSSSRICDCSNSAACSLTKKDH